MPLSDLIYLGANVTASLNESVEATYDVDKAGVIKATLGYYCRWDAVPLLIRALQVHPDFAYLRKSSINSKRTEGFMAEVTATFEGIDPEQTSGSGSGENGEVTTFAIEATLDTEPIESHPDFKEWAGEWNDKATWPDGSLGFDPAGAFLGFASTLQDGTANPKGGVKSYLNPGVIYSRTRTVPSMVASSLGTSVADAGRIVTPPASPILPETDTEQNWLQLGTTVEQIGDGMRITERWKLSGRSGWDVDIYQVGG